MSDLVPDLLAASNAASNARNRYARLTVDFIVGRWPDANRAEDYAWQSRAAYLEWNHLLDGALGGAS